MRDRINAGASYFLVLGHEPNSTTIRARKKAILEEAERLHLPLAELNVAVIDANQLGIWVSGIPSLAVHELFKGPGWNVVDYKQWSEADRYSDTWIEGEEKGEALQTLRDTIRVRPAELRVEGASGLGKSRLVLEALSGEHIRTTVVYTARRAEFSREMFNYLLTAKRPITLVDPPTDQQRRHEPVHRAPGRSDKPEPGDYEVVRACRRKLVRDLIAENIGHGRVQVDERALRSTGHHR